MTDAEISRRLAIAIGWKDDQEDPDVLLVSEWQGHESHCDVWFEDSAGRYYWRKFDYRDPAVIWKIAERFNAFPWRARIGEGWFCGFAGGNGDDKSDTAAKAVALAVIRSKEQW